jgi:hypothetical protein
MMKKTQPTKIVGNQMSNLLLNVGKYNKFIVAVLTAVSVGVTTFSGTAAWAPTVLAGIGAIVTYLVPNATPVVTPSAADRQL